MKFRSDAQRKAAFYNMFSTKAENVRRGDRFEQKIRSRLDRSNCIISMRSAGSRGLWDIACITPDKVRLIQAKTHGYIEPDERDEMLSQLQCMPDNIQAELEYYKSPRVSANFTLKKAGETDWDKVEERLNHFGKVRGFRKLNIDNNIEANNEMSISPELEGTFHNPWEESYVEVEERPLKEMKYLRGIYNVTKGHEYVDSSNSEFWKFEKKLKSDIGDDAFYAMDDRDVFEMFVKSKVDDVSNRDGIVVLPPKIRFNQDKGYGYYAEIPFRYKSDKLHSEIDNIMKPINKGDDEYRIEPTADTKEAFDVASNKYVSNMAYEIKNKTDSVPIIGISKRDKIRGSIGEGRHRILAAEMIGLEKIPVVVDKR